MIQFIHEEHHRGSIIDPRHVPGSLCSHPLPYAVTQAMCHVPGTLCGSRSLPYQPVGQRHENTTRVHNTRQMTSVGGCHHHAPGTSTWVIRPSCSRSPTPPIWMPKWSEKFHKKKKSTSKMIARKRPLDPYHSWLKRSCNTLSSHSYHQPAQTLLYPYEIGVYSHFRVVPRTPPNGRV